MNFCPKCGQPVAPTDNVCRKCGNRLQSTQRTQEQPKQQVRTPAPKQQPRTAAPKQSKKKQKNANALVVLSGILIAVLLVAAVGLVYYLLQNSEGDRDASTREVETVEEPSTQETAQTVQETEPLEKETTEEPTETAVISQVPYYVTGVADTIKLRESVDGNSAVLTKLVNGDSVLLVDTSDTQYWKVLVSDEDLYGYIDCHYLTDEAAAVTAPETYYVANTPAYLSVLDVPQATGYTELGRLDNGDTVTVLSKLAGNFWYVYSGTLGQYGYVLNTYLSTTEPVSATPTPTATVKVFGVGTAPASYLGVYYVHVNTGYLALRNAMAFDTSNELGKMYNGDFVYAIEATAGDYWYVYSPSLGMYGYTNHNYLTASATTASGTTSTATTTYKTVSVKTGYLALRTAKAYDTKNEIGCLYSGDQVQVVDTSDATYWYVYAPTLGKYGYVNCNYLY